MKRPPIKPPKGVLGIHTYSSKTQLPTHDDPVTLYCATELIQTGHWFFACVVLLFGFCPSYKSKWSSKPTTLGSAMDEAEERRTSTPPPKASP